ncbi:MAG TPA: hypothetical protein VHM70_15575 [Polyangiaceae bacterium]|jgi:hypothetical protein|nr:hypothetical protein [Polyangiaceae bacterium]
MKNRFKSLLVVVAFSAMACGSKSTSDPGSETHWVGIGPDRDDTQDATAPQSVSQESPRDSGDTPQHEGSPDVDFLDASDRDAQPENFFECAEGVGLPEIGPTMPPPAGPDVTRDLSEGATTITDAVDLSIGYDHACAVHRSGRVSCWGSNRFGQLGNGSFDDAEQPVEVTGIDDAVHVVCGHGLTCVLRSTGTVACSGDNGEHSTGFGDEGFYSTLVPVCELHAVDQLVSDGSYYMCAIHDHQVNCWGYYDGLVAVATGMDDVVSVGLSGSVACVVRADGSVSCWGIGATGYLNDPPDEPRIVDGISDAIALGEYAHCALHDSGSVSCTYSFFATHVVADLDDAIALSIDSPCAIRSNGKVACWEASSISLDPDPGRVAIDVPDVENAIAVSGNCAVLADGQITCWDVSTDGGVHSQN